MLFISFVVGMMIGGFIGIAIMAMMQINKGEDNDT
jgi:hypothetical protein